MGGALSAGRVLALIATLAVVGAIGGALTLIDSPSQTRKLRLDKLRTADLDRLAVKIDCYWSLESRLPADLAALEKRTARHVGYQRVSIACRRPLPHDPETGAAYPYRALVGGTAFELCATFAAASQSKEVSATYYGPRRTRNWTHQAGRQCFRLEPVRIEKF